MHAATISFTELQVRLLFKGGYYLVCGFYLNKYGMSSYGGSASITSPKPTTHQMRELEMLASQSQPLQPSTDHHFLRMVCILIYTQEEEMLSEPLETEIVEDGSRREN